MYREPRLFVAVPLDELARAAVTGIVEQVRAQIPDGRGIRWVRLDGLHLTLRFIGPTDNDRVPIVAEAVHEAAAGEASTRLRLAGAGAFPPHGRPRTIWLGIDEGVDRLTALTARLDEALAARGWDPETRPFRAHVTLARTDGARSGPATAAALREAAADLSVVSAVDRLVLYESVTGGGPARYVPLEEAPLTAPGDGAAGHVDGVPRSGTEAAGAPAD
ncbi:MAG TPA: RNA 2',3'-cyclic phosphodiesterase [Candidatus Limnocylindrales bacterium]